MDIYQEDLETFLQLAEELQLKGLIGSKTDDQPPQEIATDVKLPEENKYNVMKLSYKTNQITPRMQVSETFNQTSQAVELGTNQSNKRT